MGFDYKSDTLKPSIMSDSLEDDFTIGGVPINITVFRANGKGGNVLITTCYNRRNETDPDLQKSKAVVQYLSDQIFAQNFLIQHCAEPRSSNRDKPPGELCNESKPVEMSGSNAWSFTLKFGEEINRQAFDVDDSRQEMPPHLPFQIAAQLAKDAPTWEAFKALRDKSAASAAPGPHAQAVMEGRSADVTDVVTTFLGEKNIKLPAGDVNDLARRIADALSRKK